MILVTEILQKFAMLNLTTEHTEIANGDTSLCLCG